MSVRDEETISMDFSSKMNKNNKKTVSDALKYVSTKVVLRKRRERWARGWRWWARRAAEQQIQMKTSIWDCLLSGVWNVCAKVRCLLFMSFIIAVLHGDEVAADDVEDNMKECVENETSISRCFWVRLLPILCNWNLKMLRYLKNLETQTGFEPAITLSDGSPFIHHPIRAPWFAFLSAFRDVSVLSAISNHPSMGMIW